MVCLDWGRGRGVEQSIVDLAPKIVYFLANSTLFPFLLPSIQTGPQRESKNKMKWKTIGSVFNWTLIKILHECPIYMPVEQVYAVPPIIHHESSNILLDVMWTVKVCDI